MVRKVFGIYGNDLNGKLFIETAHNYIACSVVDSSSQQLNAFELFHFDAVDTASFEKLFGDIQLFSRLFTAQYSIVDLIWANEKAVCVPAAYFDEALAVSMLETMHAVSPPVQFSVNKAEDIVVVGYIPADAFKVYAANFEVRSNEHKYFQLIRGLSHGDHKHAAYVLFDHSDFTYVVRKDGQLQLIQTRAYKTSEDVLYHLLNSFRVFAIPTQEINIVASGMIDDSSPLYKNLRSYFKHFAFQEMEASKFAAEGFNEHPLHYFASFCQ
ncbi:MAG TPA: DUF3822 family protein [Panacibacter sp.]|nr:DUF3822 family protein [Panacibacter sp.]HNP45214.1 DUF3822 family protein [Panacibacter sp.]